MTRALEGHRQELIDLCRKYRVRHMTLIVTAATAQYFAQVSDRRLTLSNGDLHDDKTNKAVVLFCQDAAVALAYTGVARIGGTPTDQYLTDLLMNLKAPQLPLAEVARALEDQLTERFQMADMQRWVAPCRRLTIVGVGLGSADQKFLYRASNFQQKAATFREAQARFQGELFVAHQPPRSQDRRPFILMTSGDDSAVSERVRLKLRALRKRRFFHSESADVVARRLVDVVREAESTQPATPTPLHFATRVVSRCACLAFLDFGCDPGVVERQGCDVSASEPTDSPIGQVRPRRRCVARLGESLEGCVNRRERSAGMSRGVGPGSSGKLQLTLCRVCLTLDTVVVSWDGKDAHELALEQYH